MMRVRISGIGRATGAAALFTALALPGFAANQSLLVFPSEKPETVDQSVADTVSSALAAQATASGKYDVATFYAKSPLVVRAISSGTITQAQMAGPFTAETTSAIAKAIGADAALISSVEDATEDAAANKANVTISAQIIGAADGKALKTAGASGDAVQANTPALALMRLAANSAAGKAATQLFGGIPVKPGRTVGPTPGATVGGQPPVIPASGPKKSKKNNSMLLIGGLLIVGAIIAASGGGGGGGGNGGSGGPPPLPL